MGRTAVTRHTPVIEAVRIGRASQEKVEKELGKAAVTRHTP